MCLCIPSKLLTLDYQNLEIIFVSKFMILVKLETNNYCTDLFCIKMQLYVLHKSQNLFTNTNILTI